MNKIFKGVQPGNLVDPQLLADQIENISHVMAHIHIDAAKRTKSKFFNHFRQLF